MEIQYKAICEGNLDNMVESCVLGWGDDDDSLLQVFNLLCFEAGAMQPNN